MIDLRCGDCVEILKTIDSKSVDTVITDPPYNVNLNYGELVNDNMSKEEYYKWCAEWFDELKRICKHNILIFTGNDNYFYWAKNIQEPSELIIWYRSNSMVRNRYMYSWRKIEPIFFYELDRNILTFHDYFDVPIGVQKGVGNHPCPKSLKLFKLLLSDFSSKGDTVLDCFLGSGTTGVAAKQMERNFIGIEISQEFFDLAKQRINNTLVSNNVLKNIISSDTSDTEN
jgi:site-specific DNA-methyltransferase (adenine-specific)